MAFKVIRLRLTRDQIEEIAAAVLGSGDFALLAEPKMDKGVLDVQICTNEQFEILQPAILKAHKLPQWRKKPQY